MSAPDVEQVRKQLQRGSREGWKIFHNELARNRDDQIVTIDWDVHYDPLSHDILIHYQVKVAQRDSYLLQVWVRDEHPGIWIPQIRPWVASAVEFDAAERITRCKGVLIDSKWTKEDAGKTYLASVWGYVRQNGEDLQFGPFSKEFEYPG